MVIEFSKEELRGSDLTLAGLLLSREVRLAMPCGGSGTCGKCRVKVDLCRDGQVIKTAELLACQTRSDDLSHFGSGDGVIRVTLEQSSLLYHGKVESSRVGDKPFLAAVDLGSTTVETAAISLDGEVLGSVRRRNPQVSYGADVLSRIRAASSSLAASDMQRLAEGTIASSISELSARYGLKAAPEEMAVAANTTMGHLLEGTDTAPLGEFPFDPGDISLHDISEVFYSDGTPVYLLPGICTFVGGDIVSGIYYLDMDKDDAVTLLIDLGTNGEMAICSGGRLLVTSTAAGPAFEAANISCGVPGLPGAIREVSFCGQKPKLSLIPWEDDLTGLSPGEKMQRQLALSLRRPAGLCGSGLISAISGMRKAGIIDEDGTYTRDEWIEKGFPLWKPSPAARGQEPLLLLQEDIRELLLAKSAIRSGIELLMKKSKAVPEKVYLAGGFGSALSPEAAIDIGLFPPSIADRVVSVANSSLLGAIRFLKEDYYESSTRLSHIVERSAEMVLAEQPGFNEMYVENLKL